MSPEKLSELRRRWLAVIVLCAAQVMIILDQNIVNVALPAIREDLDFSASNLVWTINAYVIPFGGLLLLAGRLGDLLSRKYVFVAGLALFTAASAWCGFADGQTSLLVARFVQGLGGAVTSAGLLGMVVTIFSDPKPQAKALGAFGFASAGGGAAGTVVGGVLTEGLSWHWVFWINIPLGIIVGALALRLLRNDRGIGWRAGADVFGAVLVTSGLMLVVYALVGTESRGWASPVTIGLGAAAVALLAGFFVRQAKAANPLLPLRILRSRNVAGANLIQALMVAALFGFMFYTVLYMQEVLSYRPLSAGLAFLPVPIVIAVVSMTVAPKLLLRFGPRTLILAGLPLLAFGLWLLSRVPVDGDYYLHLLPAMVIMPFGFGITMPSLMSLAMSEVAAEDSGVTSGLFNTTQQVGGAIGLAVVSTAVAARIDSTLADGGDKAQALTDGYGLGFGLGAAFVAVAWLVALTVLRQRAKPEAAGSDEPAVAAAVS
ncbi:MFS transporter [Stackebrandtia nassauensis]|uniref:Drug resistance transporter, EmrB/QacA subfamily n=1 Tax=Stackebrandtia nassauensis (strain DSM 44728 / CIP 108903 / NRRL B-16338 / NBRC 102104 / LLR-40K-21) TaxID=446470 RepID=D3Q772_STANL|nr:MFS transporter [Stackebrandtia nassauensis]ADD42343.1 drug resistance transporter, EmrB/QacA subfamily [Stackebrandtia nassauensis DSM 44728]